MKGNEDSEWEFYTHAHIFAKNGDHKRQTDWFQNGFLSVYSRKTFFLSAIFFASTTYSLSFLLRSLVIVCSAFKKVNKEKNTFRSEIRENLRDHVLRHSLLSNKRKDPSAKN